MRCVHVVTDGSVALPEDVISSFGITIVPQLIAIDDRSDGFQPRSRTEVFGALRTAPEAVTVRSSSAPAYVAAYEQVLGPGVEIVSIHPPLALSDALAEARQAHVQLPNRPITVHESPWTSTALGMICVRVADAGLEGASRDELTALADEIGQRMTMVMAARLAGDVPGDADSDAHRVVELRGGRANEVARADSVTDALREVIHRVNDSAPSDGTAHIGLVNLSLIHI